MYNANARDIASQTDRSARKHVFQHQYVQVPFAEPPARSIALVIVMIALNYSLNPSGGAHRERTAKT
jgi:hypothetical protein